MSWPRRLAAQLTGGRKGGDEVRADRAESSASGDHRDGTGPPLIRTDRSAGRLRDAWADPGADPNRPRSAAGMDTAPAGR
jgi:hypothetical protein